MKLASPLQSGAEARRDLLVLVVLSAFAVCFVAWPILGPRLAIGHDAYAYPPRVVEWLQSAREGAWPRWAPDLSRGHGQPLFVYSPFVFYAVSGALASVVDDVGLAINLALVGFLFFGAVAFAVTCRSFGLDVFVAPFALLCAPWILVDLYVRSALAELAAICLFPLALFGLSTKQRWPFGVAGLGLAVATHFPSAMILLPVFVAVSFARAFAVKARWPLVSAAVAMGGAALASAAVWVPPLWHSDAAQLARAASAYTDFRVHFLELGQLVLGDWGFGLSVPGPDDGFSFALSPLALGSGLVVVASKDRWLRTLGVTAIVLSLMATTVSAPLWELVPALGRVQFPWRFLMAPTVLLALSLAAVPSLFAHGLFGSRISFEHKRTVARILLIIGIVGFALPKVQPPSLEPVDPELLDPRSMASKRIVTTIAEEFEPVGVSRPEPPWNEIARLRSGTASVRLVRRTATRIELAIDAAAPSTLALSVHDFPTWRGSDQSVELSTEPETGLVSLRVPAGARSLVLELEPTPAERAARVVSCATLAGFVLVGGLRRSAKKRASDRGDGARDAVGQ
ncbi:MAG: hypothetical protein HY791_30345 [Deltaproteobacteria bacterium]|nr:hypothetical protein [Deltaproteobacteria bacterium]